MMNVQHLAQSALDALSAHIAILDESGAILAVNRAWRNFTAANDAPPLLEGANYLAACDTGNDESRAFAAGIRAVLQGEQPEFSLEYPYHEQRWFFGRVTRFQDEGIPRVIVTHEDITERKLAELKSQYQEAVYRTLAQQIPSTGVLLFDHDLRYLLPDGPIV